jgi:hypothetical protein
MHAYQSRNNLKNFLKETSFLSSCTSHLCLFQNQHGIIHVDQGFMSASWKLHTLLTLSSHTLSELMYLKLVAKIQSTKHILGIDFSTSLSFWAFSPH